MRKPNGTTNGRDAVPAEQAVLGALLIDGSAWSRVAPRTGVSDFDGRDHRLIFDAMARLVDEHKRIDITTVSEMLERQGKLTEAGGLAYLGTLARDTVSAANIESYAADVRERAARRRLVMIGTDVCAAVRSGQDVPAIVRHTRDALTDLEVSLADDPRAAWPEPVNLLQDMAAPPFTGDELPAVLARFPLAYARATGFDASIALSAASAAAAAALSDGFQIIGDSASRWYQQARLWVLNIARPGTGKTPTQRATIAPLWDIQKEVREAHARQAAGKAADDPAPAAPRVILTDATVEALSEVLRDNPRGVLIANDEFEGFIGALDSYRRAGVSRDRAAWLQIFDGGPYTIERVQRGSVYVPNWGASILTACTPATLAKLTRQLPEDGLLQRFIPVIGGARGEAADFVDVDGPREQYAELLRRLYAAAPRAHGGCVSLSSSAQGFLRTWQREAQLLQEAFGAVEPALESHLAKGPALLLRLALIFHAANIVSHEDRELRDPAAFPVPLETIETAARFLKRARLHAVAIYSGQKGGGEAFDIARDIARAILAKGWERVERRHLSSGIRSFRGAEREAQEAAIRLLIDLAWLRPSESGYRATQARLDVNPRLAAKFAAIAERERDRRAAVREAIAETVESRRSERRLDG